MIKLTNTHKTTLAIAPFPFTCKLCGKPVDIGTVLDRGGGNLDLVCVPCANLYFYTENFLLPSSVPGLTFNRLVNQVKTEHKHKGV